MFELLIEYKNGRKHVYSVDDFCLDLDHNLLELYAWYFPTHAKAFKLSSILKIVKYSIVGLKVQDKVIIYEVLASSLCS